MPTGLKTNKLSFAKMGNINIQAVKPQSESNNFGSLNQDAFVVAKNQIVGSGGNLAQNASVNISPFSNPFQKLQVALPPLKFKSLNLIPNNTNNLNISPIVAQLFIPAKLKGISEQRPEIISLIDFASIYSRQHGEAPSDVGNFINTSIAARKLRFDHIGALIESIQEVEDANAILEEIFEDYANKVLTAKQTVNLMSKISKTINNIKSALDVRKSESFSDEKIAQYIVDAKSYKSFLVELYGFSESGVDNFSNTKLVGQFLFDARNTLKQYSPTLFGQNSALPPNTLNAGLGFQVNKPGINQKFFNANFGLGEAEEQTVERNADRNFGTYNVNSIDINDGQFNFQTKLFRNIAFPLVGTAFNQFLDVLPGAPIDRAALLLMVLSKELRISSGLGDENVQNILLNNFNGDTVEDPFEYIIGSPGDNITDSPNGTNSLCSLLRYKNTNNEIVLPLESVYVRGENNVLYKPGTKEFGDSILQSEEPYDITRLKAYQERVSFISGDAIVLIKSLLDIGQGKSKLKPTDLFKDIGRSYIEAIDLLTSNLPTENIELPGSWAEVSLIKMASSDREIKQLLFQYVLALGLIGKPGEGEFGNNSVESFFRDMSLEELTIWGDLPSIGQDKDLSEENIDKLTNILTSLGFSNDQVEDAVVSNTKNIANTPTKDSVTGYSVLAFLAQTLINKAKQKGSQNGGPGAVISNQIFVSHLISTKNLIFFNRIVDFVATIAKSAGDFTQDGRSRLNRLNYTTIAAFAFEAFLSFIEPLIGNGISQPNVGNDYMTISFDKNLLRESQEIMGLVLANFNATNPTGTTQYNKFLSINASIQNTPIANLRLKLVKEEKIVQQIIARIRKTFELIENVTSDAVDYFRPDGPNRESLNKLLEEVGGKERIAMISNAQFVLSRRALQDFSSGEGLSLITKNIVTFRSGKPRNTQTRIRGRRNLTKNLFLYKRVRIQRIEIPVFVDGSVITPNEKSLMDIILGRPKFRGRVAENMKILTVGLPAGFNNYLSSEIGVTEDNANETLDKQRDVVSINVYKRSVEFEDIVFKPKSYIFELSRFINRSDLNRVDITPNLFIEFLNDKSIEFMRDYSDRPRGDLQSRVSFFENEEYSFLNNSQKSKLIANHIESFVLGLYLQLLTGISTDENDYFANTELLNGYIDDEAKQRFSDLVLTYVRGITQEPLSIEQLKSSSPQIKSLLEKIDTFALETNFTEQITPPVLPGVSIDKRIELTEDLVNFVKLFTPKSLLTGGDIQALRITSPKLFERIFNLAVDPDDFEIDLDKTFETTSGKKMYVTLEKNGLLKSGGKYIRERSRNSTISLDQFFVNISTVGSEDSE